MLTGRELALGIVGAWRLVRADRTAMLCFDRSPRGFWRSFWMILLLAPAQAILIAMNLADLKIDPVSGHVMVLQAGVYITDWLLLPAVLSEFALRRGRVAQFMSFTIANNYAQALLAALWLMALAIGNMLPDGPSIVVQLVALGLSLFYQYRIARVAFDADRLLAALVVLLSLGLSLILQSVNSALLLAFIPAA